MKATFSGVLPTILSLDDSERTLMLRRVILERQGYTVLSATRTREAIALLEDNHVDAIITDFNMPEKNGTEFARRVRRRGYTMPIIMYSGSVDHGEAKGVITEFIGKEVPIPLLLNRLASHLMISMDQVSAATRNGAEAQIAS